MAGEYRELTIVRNEFLRQNCKVQWIKDGDHNTRQFHSSIKARWNANRVFAITYKNS